MSRLKEQYNKEIVPSLQKEFKYSSPMQVPKLLKVVINVGVGEATQNAKALQSVEYGVRQMSGQKPVVTRSKKAISNFKLRENQGIGVMVTLRGKRMYDFVDRFVSLALPRTRDFRGVPTNFNGGNYTVGIKEQTVFSEVDMEKTDKIRGAGVTFVTNAKTAGEARALLTKLGMPFKK